MPKCNKEHHSEKIAKYINSEICTILHFKKGWNGAMQYKKQCEKYEKTFAIINIDKKCLKVAL